MSIISTPSVSDATESVDAKRPPKVHHEKVLHPERFEGPLPRRREHITLIRWFRDAYGDWTYECVPAQFLRAESGRWTVTIAGAEHEYDMSVWSVCAN